VAEEYARLDEADFHAMLHKLKARRVALVGATMSSMPSFAAFINEAHESGLESLIIADGLGWTGDWYRMTGSASDYVLDQIPG
jgi:branched-chain amino acid transport system substrate-binding protein